MDNSDSESREDGAGEPVEAAQSIHDAARRSANQSKAEEPKKAELIKKTSAIQAASSVVARLDNANSEQDFDAWLDELDAKLAAASALLDKAAEEKEAMHRVEAEIAVAQKLAANRIAQEGREGHLRLIPGAVPVKAISGRTAPDFTIRGKDEIDIDALPDATIVETVENLESNESEFSEATPIVSEQAPLPVVLPGPIISPPAVINISQSVSAEKPLTQSSGQKPETKTKYSAHGAKSSSHATSGGAAAVHASTVQSRTGAPMYESELADEFVKLRSLAFDDRFWSMTKLLGEFAKETARNKWMPNKKISETDRKRDLAVRFRNALVELGPTFIKLGQFLSVRRDLLDAEMADELATLQDNVPPFSAELAIKTIAAELGQEPDKLFLEFDNVPLASASIGQVHRAKLHDGRQVVVKVQRPDLASKFYQDLGYMRSLIRWGRRIKKEGDWDGWLALSDEFGRSLFSEIDYIQEGKNADRMRLNLRDSTRIRIPRVIWKYTGRHVLAFEYAPGIKIDNITELKARNFDLVEIGNQLVYAYLEQVLIHGYFHADPHAGNLAVDNEGRIIIYDFGMVGEISEAQRLAIAGCVTAVIDKSGEDVAQHLVELGVLTADSNKAPVVRTLTPFIDYYSGKSMRDLDFNNLERDIDQIALERALRLPANLAYLLRAGSSVEGIARTLQPDFSFVEGAKPFIQKWLLSKPSAFGVLLKIFLQYSREAYRTSTERLTGGQGIFGFGKKKSNSLIPEPGKAQQLRHPSSDLSKFTVQGTVLNHPTSTKGDIHPAHSTSVSNTSDESKVANNLRLDPSEELQTASSGGANLALERDRLNQQRQIYLLETRLGKSVRLLMVLGCSSVGSLVFSSLFLIASFLADYRSYAHYFLIGNGVMGAIILWHLVEAALLGKNIQGKR